MNSTSQWSRRVTQNIQQVSADVYRERKTMRKDKTEEISEFQLAFDVRISEKHNIF